MCFFLEWKEIQGYLCEVESECWTWLSPSCEVARNYYQIKDQGSAASSGSTDEYNTSSVNMEGDSEHFLTFFGLFRKNASVFVLLSSFTLQTPF